MADSEEMRRLILHAADRCSQESLRPAFRALAATNNRDEDATVLREALSLRAALTLAETTLRFVAACMAVDEPAGGDQ